LVSSYRHNTLTVDDLSASVSSGPFKWEHVAKQRLECWHDDASFSYFVGSHDGYQRLPNPVVHRRQVFFPAREYWILLDSIESTGSHRCRAHFHLAPDLLLDPNVVNGGLTIIGDDAALDLVTLGNAAHWQTGESWISPVYARRVSAAKAELIFESNGNADVMTLLLARHRSEAAPAIRPLSVTSGKGAMLAFTKHHDYLLWRASGCSEAGVAASNCEWLWKRSEPENAMFQKMICLHGQHLECEGFAIHASRPFGFAHVERQGSTLRLRLSDPIEVTLQLPTDISSVILNGKSLSVSSSGVVNTVAGSLPDVSPSICEVCSVHVRH
jgi:hypothetical protein